MYNDIVLYCCVTIINIDEIKASDILSRICIQLLKRDLQDYVGVDELHLAFLSN